MLITNVPRSPPKRTVSTPCCVQAKKQRGEKVVRECQAARQQALWLKSGTCRQRHVCAIQVPGLYILLRHKKIETRNAEATRRRCSEGGSQRLSSTNEHGPLWWCSTPLNTCLPPCGTRAQAAATLPRRLCHLREAVCFQCCWKTLPVTDSTAQRGAQQQAMGGAENALFSSHCASSCAKLV